jgi:hypothetical protein
MTTESAEATMRKKIDETQLAEAIVGVLPDGVVRACSSDRSVIRYSVRAEGLKLRSIVLNRMSLRKLATDPDREVKVEYLRRDLAESAQTRSEFRYPRLHLHPKPAPRTLPLGLPFASML